MIQSKDLESKMAHLICSNGNIQYSISYRISHLSNYTFTWRVIVDGLIGILFLMFESFGRLDLQFAQI